MPSAPLPGARRWWALGALILALLALSLDMTVLNVALPTLAADLHADTSQMQWVIASYTLVMAALLLPAGLLGDRFGRKRLLLVGLLLFGAASAVAAFVGSPGELIAARAAMGIGAAILMPLSLSTLPVLFPPEERTKAIAVWTAASAAGMPLGPIVGGYLLQHFWWGSVFIFNVPVAAIGLVACAVLLPESRNPSAPRFDLPGMLLSTGGLVALVYGIIQAPVQGWADPVTVGAQCAGLVLLLLFVLWERRTAAPLVDLRLFRDLRFAWGAGMATAMTFAIFGALFVLPLYLQDVHGNDAFGTGIRILPLMAGLMVGARAGDAILQRFGHRVTIATSLFIASAALGLGALTAVDDPYWYTATWPALLGAGLGLGLPAAMGVALSALPDESAGLGSGLLMTLRMVGGALGTAVLGTVLNTIYRSDLDVDALPAAAARIARDSVSGALAVAERLGPGGAAFAAAARQSFTTAMDGVLWVCALIALSGGVVTAVFLRGTLSAPARDGAAEGAGGEPGPDTGESDHERLRSPA